MTPDHLQAVALQWIAVTVAVVLAIISGYTSVKSAFLGALHTQQIDQNTARLNGQSDKIDTLLLGANPPGKPAVTTTVTGPDGTSTTLTQGTPANVPPPVPPAAIVPPGTIVPGGTLSVSPAIGLVGTPNAAPLAAESSSL